MLQYLDFEKSVAELEGKAEELRVLAKDDPDMDIGAEVSQLEEKAQKQLSDLYGKLTPWRRCQVARHPNRPHALQVIEGLIDDFTPVRKKGRTRTSACAGTLAWRDRKGIAKRSV